MSILISGMEMPKNCFECRFSIDGFCYASGHVNIRANEERQITNYCPLVPVPPHGRLIDADANIATLQKCEDDPESELAKICYGYAKKVIAACPTIIPASGKEGEK